MVEDCHLEAWTAVPKNRNHAGAQATQCRVDARRMSHTGLVTNAVRFHEIPHYRRVGEHCICACLHARASVPQAHSENRAVAECRYRHQYVYGSSAKNSFAEQTGSLRWLWDVDSRGTRVESKFRLVHLLLHGMHDQTSLKRTQARRLIFSHGLHG